MATRKRQKPLPDASLTASGERINLSDRDIGQKITRQRGADWQKLAWNYRDMIGELGSGIQYGADILSKVAYKVGAVSGEDEPYLDGTDEFDKALPARVAKAARDALDRLPWRQGYSFTGIGSTCLRVAGEAWLHGKTDRGRERWRVLSSDEVQPISNKLGIIELPGMAPEPLGEDEVLLRMWQPHPRYKRLADSPLRRMLDTCEDIVLIGRELRAVSRSRVASNGILVIPNEVSMVRKPDGTYDDFQTELEALMLAPIANEGDAGAVVPVVLRGPAEVLKLVQHISIQREESPQLIEKLTAALGRLREGMTMPADAGQSMANMNHWSAWVVSTENWKSYLEPHARLWVDGLTEAYLRPSLTLAPSAGGFGLSEAESDLVQIWYDAGNITENANRSEDAKAAHDRGEIGGDAFREAMGFSVTDAPSDKEFQRMVAWKAAATLPPEAGALLLENILGNLMPGVSAVVNGQVVDSRRGAIEVSRPAVRSSGTNEVPTTGRPGVAPPQPVPAPPAGIQGAGNPQGVLDKAELLTGEELAEVERSLRDRLLVAADDALLRALERAGTRVRGAAQKHHALAERVKGLAAEDVCPALGEGHIIELGLTEHALLNKAFEHLRVKWDRWVGQGVRQVVRTVADMLGLGLAEVAALAQRLTSRIGDGWKTLEARLTRRALAKLYGADGDEARGEVPDTLAHPGDIRVALAVVGGTPPESSPDRPGGLALGRDVTTLLDRRCERLGFVWKYGITPRGRQFEPHKRLDTHRFLGWDDAALATDASTAWVGTHFAPGDHEGCLCDYVPTWARLETIGLLATEIEPESAGARSDRILAELDDAAGRTSTTAQRNRDERERVLAVQRHWMEHA